MNEPDPLLVDAAPARLAWVDPLVVAALYAVGVVAIAGWPASFASADDRIALTAPIAAVACAVLPAIGFAARRLRTSPPVVRAAILSLAALLFLAIPLICLIPALRPLTGLPGAAVWSTQKFGRLVANLLFVYAAVMIAARYVERLTGPATVRLLLLGMASAAAALIAMTGSIRIAQKTGALAAAIAVVLVIGALWRPARRTLAQPVVLVVVILVTQFATAHFWSELAVWQAACVLVAPIVGAVAAPIPFVRRCRPWLRGAIVLLLAATPALVACGIAGAEAYRSSQRSGADDYGY